MHDLALRCRSRASFYKIEPEQALLAAFKIRENVVRQNLPMIWIIVVAISIIERIERYHQPVGEPPAKVFSVWAESESAMNYFENTEIPVTKRLQLFKDIFLGVIESSGVKLHQDTMLYVRIWHSFKHID
jgi:hypothetical protein